MEAIIQCTMSFFSSSLVSYMFRFLAYFLNLKTFSPNLAMWLVILLILKVSFEEQRYLPNFKSSLYTYGS